MKKRRIVDSSKLIEAVESGQLDRNLVSKFGIETSRTRKLGSKEAADKEKALRRRQGAGSGKNKKITVNQRGSLVVPREIVETLGFELGETFQVKKTNSGISLKRT